MFHHPGGFGGRGPYAGGDILWGGVDQQIPYACLNPLLLFISGAHGMGVRGVFWGNNE